MHFYVKIRRNTYENSCSRKFELFSLWSKKTISVKIIYSLFQVIFNLASKASLATLFDTQFVDKQKPQGVVTYQ